MAERGRILIPGFYSSDDSDDAAEAAEQEQQQVEEEPDTSASNAYEGDPHEELSFAEDDEQGDYSGEVGEAEEQQVEDEEYVPTAQSIADYQHQPSSSAAQQEEEEEEHFFVVDIQARAIRVRPKGFSEKRYVALEKMTAEDYSLLGQRVYESDRDDDDDDYVYCDMCVAYFSPSCLQHPLYRINDRVVSSSSDDRAKRTLPGFLHVRKSSIPNAGSGVFTSVEIPIGCVFGPYQGLLLEDARQADQKGYSWEIRLPGQNLYLDGSDTRYSNWMRYINSSRHDREQNLLAFQYNGSVYYRVYKPINIDQELLVWYGAKYGESLGVFSTKATGTSKLKALLQKETKNPYIY